MNNRQNEAKAERIQQRLDAGIVSVHFPEVAGIVISMIYNKKGIQSLLRTLNFYPSSAAFFRVDCLNRDCVDGGFDLTQVVTAMIGNRKEAAKGELSCEGNGLSANHSVIVYEVAIQYA